MKQFAMVVGLSILTVTAQGQTFKQTVSWMHHASEYNSSLRNGDLDFTEVPLDNTCHHFLIVQKHTGKYSSTWTVTLDLSTIEPRRVIADPVKGKPWAYVDVATTNDEEHIETQTETMNMETGQTRRSDKTAGVMLYFGDGTFAPRFAKALRHAVELCGGKPSTF